MRRSAILLFFLLILQMPSLAQNLTMSLKGEVASHATDLDAKTYYPVLDQNDNLCALIKVTVTNPLKNPLSLSVGGPIVLPESKVLVIAPIASHNLNVRPLVVPDTSEISIGLQSRDEQVILTMDNRSAEVSPDIKVGISMAQFSLKRVRLNSSDFINALTSKLFWGEDIRNSTVK